MTGKSCENLPKWASQLPASGYEIEIQVENEETVRAQWGMMRHDERFLHLGHIKRKSEAPRLPYPFVDEVIQIPLESIIMITYRDDPEDQYAYVLV